MNKINEILIYKSEDELFNDGYRRMYQTEVKDSALLVQGEPYPDLVHISSLRQRNHPVALETLLKKARSVGANAMMVSVVTNSEKDGDSEKPFLYSGILYVKENI